MTTTVDDYPTPPSYARLLFGLNALLALAGVALSFTLNITGYYVDDIDPEKPTILGNTLAGVDTPLERFFDWTTYFTILSNIVVLVAMALLFFRPGLFVRNDRVGAFWRTMRLDALLMIIITGVVYNTLLASGGKEGWDLVSNFIIHIANPIVVPLVWLVAGPRGIIRQKTIYAALILPIGWAVYALIRGQFVGAYPYPFLDVATNGWASVITFIVVIAIIAIILGYVLLGIDRVLRRVQRSEEKTA
jgi:hypothetical protein